MTPTPGRPPRRSAPARRRAVDVVAGRARPHRRVGRPTQRVHRRDGRGGAGARAAEVDAGVRRRPAGRRPDLGQGPRLARRAAGHQRLARAAPTSCPTRLRLRRAAARRRRDRRRQDQQPRVLLPRRHRQRRCSARPATRATRPARPAGRAAGAAASVAAGMVPLAVGHRRRRVDPHPVGVLRHVRAEADLRARAEDAGLPRLADAVGHRPDRRVGARPRAGAVGDGRPVARPTSSAVPAPPATTSAAVADAVVGRAAGGGVGRPRLRRARPRRARRVRRGASTRSPRRAPSWSRRTRRPRPDRAVGRDRAARGLRVRGPAGRGASATSSATTPRRSRWPARRLGARLPRRAGRPRRLRAGVGGVLRRRRRAADADHAGDRVRDRPARAGDDRRPRRPGVVRRLVRARPAGQPGRPARGLASRSGPAATGCRSACR